MASITFGILTISDSCASNISRDASGPEVERLVTNVRTEPGRTLKGKILLRDIVPDDEDRILDTLTRWSDEERVNVILTTGGTGFSERDVTPEATKRAIEKEAPGISMAIFKRSMDVTPMAMLSRAVSGIRRKTLIINLPGSPKAVKECLSAVATVLPHAVSLIQDDASKVAAEHKIIREKLSTKSLTPDVSTALPNLEIEMKDVANRMRQSPFPMISFEQAEELIEKSVDEYLTISKNRTESVTVQQSRGRILAVAVHSSCDLPPFRASVKDGYAVIASDGKGKRNVLGGVEAGHEPGIVRLKSGYCVRVNTGAPIPDEATAVVQVEDTTLSESAEGEETSVEILVAPTEGQDIRPVGCDIRKGEKVIDAMQKIGAVEMGILAACGLTHVEVYRIPTVGILSTGNELQTPGQPPKPGHVYDSNKITLMTMIEQSGYKAVDFGIVADDLEKMICGIGNALYHVDVLITSGSVSMGDRDMLKPILKRIFRAEIHFGRVNLKPGKPTTYATLGTDEKKKFVLCLPGNPVSATVTAHLFAIPLLRRLSMDRSEPIVVIARMTEDYKLDPRPEYARAKLVWKPNDGIPYGYITGNQMSSMLTNCKEANALLMLPGKTGQREALKKGECVSAMLFFG